MTTTSQGQGMLSDSQRATLAARLRKGRTGTPSAIPRRAPGVDVPLSFGQEQLWFIDQFAPGLATYNIAGGLRLLGPLVVDAWGRAVDALVERHEALRTRLVSGPDGLPLQLVDSPRRDGVELVDVSVFPLDEREGRLQEFASAEALRPFVLAEGPLFRLHLVKLADDEHFLLMVVHHTIFDGWSFEVMRRDLAALYHAELAGEPAGLPELPIQFGDYALWERERLQGETLERMVDYWRNTLHGLETVQMPTDRPRPALATFDGGLERVRMGGSDLLDGLRALGRQEGTTPFAILLAALQVLLRRYSGQDDIVVGTASANRTRAELAPLIGFLVNTLPIRTDLSGDPSFREVLKQVNDNSVAAYAHQDLPFAKLVDALRVERDPSRAPIFQIGFTQANADEELKTGDVIMRAEPVDMLPAKFDLNFFAKFDQDELWMDGSYARALFDAATVQRMLGNLAVLLKGIVADPSRRLSQLPLLTDEEWRREVVEWNDTAVEFPVTCLHEQFEQQATRVPDAIAVEMDGESISYAELNARANQIAGELRAMGVGPEVLVGICMQPSIRRIAVLLGILKAGGAYVPLDPDLPVERLTFMVSDANCPVVVVDSASRPAVAETPATVLDVDDDWPATRPTGNADSGVTPSNVAYVIYTSGSTGQPKGVVVEHRHALNFLIGMIRHWDVGPGWRVLQFASLSFDVSVMDIFMPLCSGATLVLPSKETRMSPPQLAKLLRDREITFACMPPAVVNLLTGEQFPDLQVVLSAGEELPSELLRKWLRPGLRFYNGYGPTETAIGAVFGQMDGSVFPPPIGRPKPNYQAYVLDQYLNPVPVGVVGELHIGGVGVTRGYLNRPELTAERFIDDPFRPGQRLYKTGDLVRRRPDGQLQFVGRIDGQVKIHGLRIEVGEIEAVLVSYPGVAQAVVNVAEDPTGDKQLVGYARVDKAPLDGPVVTPADLRQHLAQRLPGYMVPQHVLILDEFPLTQNGKIDKAALPEPSVRDAAADYVAPRTIIEMMLVDTFATLLNREQVGIEDSFFDLGGNSLQAMQLVTTLRNDLAVDLGVTVVFLAPTPRQMAELLRDEYAFEDADLGADGLPD